MALGHCHISYMKNALAYYDTTVIIEEMITEKVHKEMSFTVLAIVTINCLNDT
jgi:hypothetical protein